MSCSSLANARAWGNPMATDNVVTAPNGDQERLKAAWVERLSDLVETVRGWAEASDWSTRRIEITMRDSEVGAYKAPALVLQ